MGRLLTALEAERERDPWAAAGVRRILADRVLDDVPSYAAAPWGVQE